MIDFIGKMKLIVLQLKLVCQSSLYSDFFSIHMEYTQHRDCLLSLKAKQIVKVTITKSKFLYVFLMRFGLNELIESVLYLLYDSQS